MFLLMILLDYFEALNHFLLRPHRPLMKNTRG